jgi:hypothetical protein
MWYVYLLDQGLLSPSYQWLENRVKAAQTRVWMERADDNVLDPESTSFASFHSLAIRPHFIHLSINGS